MPFIDTLGFCLSVFGSYNLVLYSRYLLPCYLVPLLSPLLNETQLLLDRAEEIGAILPQSEWRARLDSFANQSAMMRVESHHARGIFRQLCLALLRGMTYRLCSIYYEIKAVKSELELAVDEQQLAIAQVLTGTALPSPATATASPMNDVIEPTLPLPVTTS